MKSTVTARTSRPLLLASFGLFALVASSCGSSQRGAEDRCPTAREGLSSAQWDQWAGCAQTGVDVSPSDCRGAYVYAQAMSPLALEAATRCLLSSGESSDAGLVGETLQQVVTSDGRVESIARGLAPHYTNAKHGNAFAGALQQTGERALGFHIGKIEEPARTELIRTAFAWGLRTLAEASLPFISDPSVLARDAESLASSAEGRRNLTEVDRFALVATGRWGANEIITCKDGRHRACPDAGDVSHLRLLQHDRQSTRTSVGTSRVAEQLQSTITDPDISSIVLDWLADPSTPNNRAMMDSIRNGMASAETSMGFRMSTAQGANSLLCSPDGFEVARGIQTNASTTPTEPWLVFLNRCATQVWTFEEILRIYGHGRNINASPAVFEAMDARILESAENATCSQVKALADQVATWNTTRVPTMPVVYAELHRVLPSCQSTLKADVVRVARDTNAAPEARLASIAQLARSGDRSLCGSVSGIATTRRHDGRTVTLPGAVQAKADATAACR